MNILERGGFDRSLNVQSPFIATAYHRDRYPKGNGRLGPGEDNIGKWDMYHGEDIPGFPAHPHRGFETITVVERGIVDHSDGLGGSGRYANGDVQWMTAGKGLQHCEMFPLLNTETDNPLNLFQIWLNLDSKNKLVEPEYKMFWSEDIPIVELKDDNNKITKIKLIAGTEGDVKALEPTEHSWAKNPENHVAIKLITMDIGAKYTILKGSDTINRAVYLFEEEIVSVDGKITIDGEEFGNSEYAFLKGGEDILLENIGDCKMHILLLEGEPIREAVAKYGPFVMNDMDEIRQAYVDFQKTEFGGWPFDKYEVNHGLKYERFAKYSNGNTEYPNKNNN